jgi:2-hydroxychromene-2-carboxylate isomerase
MSPTVDVYWSFRSPYSYLATPDLLKLREDYAVEVKLRPVLPIAIRAKQSLFDPKDQSKLHYILLDVARRAEYLGMKMDFPSPDPIAQNLETFEVADEQPYINRLTSLGVEAERRGKGIDLAYAVSHMIWGGTKNWDQGDCLKNALASVGLDLEELEAAIAEYDAVAEIEKNQQALEAAGHWGVPTMVFNGEPFFGQDRIETLRWRLDQCDLRKS